MWTIERKDLVDAVLLARDETDPDLDRELLVQIVEAEADAGGDGETALRAIDALVTAALDRGVGLEHGLQTAADESEEDNG